jgi:hypothetical protein
VKWREEKGLTLFSLWSPSHPGTEVDLFVEEPFDFEEAWSRRLDAAKRFAEAAQRARKIAADDRKSQPKGA